MNQLRDNLKTIGLSPNHIFQQVKEAISEDLAGGEDITSVATITDSQVSTADFICRADGIVSGLHVAAAVLEYCGINHYEVLVDEGAKVSAGKILITVQANTRKLLLAERTAINFLSHLSGISTSTSKWVSELSGTKCKVRDTRKTTPGLRQLEKFAVRMGAGLNHRISLSESALIKDNHIVAAGSITNAFKLVKQKFPNKKVEIEVDTLEQLSEAILLKPDLILLDNMSVDQCIKAVSISNGAVKLEASGGLTLENAKAYANTGIDYMAVGALTHSAPILDIGLDFRKEK
ncbi:MAG: carboxylating nicotinate-nucleotide diphosphorylase [Actinobacteria bacterium]|jgi:nicotinate-nucleotide pyrophosphorylase (carboxylating)|uniref:nicotinate-nucleotide diphosphorylase (carboxylating) n=1 Tax=freshwater metagenome TaxID=449393 RepID=A0A6J6FFH0_9ZZZZ|nr:carboxylating nicotinate-nucleotide diphosphorylase [Actinomycetota bacterium]MSY10649.1 carboxylating nicotinate-nucleotide diphosphorylase [Actinomycetota bacterium]MTA34821.1 carboxylating nicotinate-nucleotide diphosphorylase [Actinomycetota bacterium]